MALRGRLAQQLAAGMLASLLLGSDVPDGTSVDRGVAAGSCTPRDAADDVAETRPRIALHRDRRGPHVARANPPTRATTLTWRSPVRGQTTSGFGPRRAGFHRGIDIAARHGTPVAAPAAGTVAFAGWRPGYGRTVVIDHGRRIRTVYGHLSDIRVKRGQRVRPGVVIARTGKTGRASGPHLHYEVHVDGRAVDPRAALAGSAGGVRARAGIDPPADARRVALAEPTERR